jgi:hypothetical protein
MNIRLTIEFHSDQFTQLMEFLHANGMEPMSAPVVPESKNGVTFNRKPKNEPVLPKAVQPVQDAEPVEPAIPAEPEKPPRRTRLTERGKEIGDWVAETLGSNRDGYMKIADIIRLGEVHKFSATGITNAIKRMIETDHMGEKPKGVVYLINENWTKPDPR